MQACIARAGKSENIEHSDRDQCSTETSMSQKKKF